MQTRPRRRIPPPQPQQNVYVEFEPLAEWVQEPSSHILRLHLPGLSEKSGKITVWGRRQAEAFLITGFERSYDVPKDSNLEKMTGKINGGVLELTIPKTVAAVEPEKAGVPFEEKKKEPEIIADGTTTALEGRKEETVQPNEVNVAEAAAGLREMNREPTMNEPKMAVEERKEAEEAAAAMNELKEVVEEPKPDKKAQIAAEEMKEKEAAKDRLKMLEEKEKSKQKEVAGGIDEKMIEEEEEEAIQRKTEETQQEHQPERFAEKNDESAKKEDPNKARHCHEELQESQKEKEDRGKRRRPWNEEDKRWLGWLDSEFIDGVLKKVKRNGKLITIALVIFSTGIYISKKLRKRR